jgi:hypothetical protein
MPHHSPRRVTGSRIRDLVRRLSRGIPRPRLAILARLQLCGECRSRTFRDLPDPIDCRMIDPRQTCLFSAGPLGSCLDLLSGRGDAEILKFLPGL